MNRYEDISYPEIAKKLFVNQKTVEYHISKALKALRAVLKDYLSFFDLSNLADFFVFRLGYFHSHVLIE